MQLTLSLLISETDVPHLGRHCIRRCLHIYGYVFAPLQDGCKAEFALDRVTQTKGKGVIIPVTDGIIEYQGELGEAPAEPYPKPKGRKGGKGGKGGNTPPPSPPHFSPLRKDPSISISPSRSPPRDLPNERRLVRQDSFNNVMCRCKTREDLGALFQDNRIDVRGFEKSKIKSSHEALKKLRSIFNKKKNVINLLGHREAMGLIYVQMSKGLKPERKINVMDDNSRTTVMEAMGVDTNGLTLSNTLRGYKTPFSKYQGNYWWDVQI